MFPLFLLPFLVSGSARAASFDPDLDWRTLATEHFNITFHGGEEQLAEEMARAAETAWETLTVEIQNAPEEPIELVLVDYTDSANGYASIVPKNAIVIFVTAPEEDSTLSLYEDWSAAIVTHELTHILHISTVRGLPRVARFLMGSLISTHQLSPGWIVEGYATFEETRQTSAGRGRHAAVDMIKRAAVLEGALPPLGNMDGFQVLPPAGNLRYLFGQDFIQFVADRTGAEKWTEWVQRYGASVPYILPAKRVFGESFVRLHNAWKTDLAQRYEAQAARIRAGELSAHEFLTPEGDSCGAPSWRPDGKQLAYSCNDPRVGMRVLLADASGANGTVVLKDRFARNIAWRADGGAFVYSTGHTVKLYNAFEDVYMYNVEDDAVTSMTNGARARDPSFSPDGTRLVVVTNAVQNNQLAVLQVDKQLRPLTDHTDHTQYGTPRYSPDGRVLAVSIWRAGFRDVWVTASDGQPWRRLTADTAIDREPAWSADGRWLYFTSDRSGVPNIYAIELETERLYQVTNVLTGAFGAAPHPDGTRMAFQYYTAAGTRIAAMNLDRSAWKEVGLLPAPLDQPAGGIGADGRIDAAAGAAERAAQRLIPAEPPATPVLDDAPVAPVFARSAEPYNPLPSLLPPRFWIPGVYLTSTGDSYGLLGTAATYGTDTLRYFAYSGFVSFRSDAAFFGGGGSFTVNRWRPIVSVGGSTSVSPYGDVYVSSGDPPGGGATLPGIESTRSRYWDRRVRGYAQFAYPLTERTSATVYYNGTWRSPLDPLPDDVYVPALPTRGFFSTLGASWRYAKGTSYALSISPEKARSLAVSAEITPAWLGSTTFDDTNARIPFNQVQATAEWREYVTNPWLPNHVLAWKLAGGASLGDTFRYGSFRLGGSFSENGITVIPSEWRSLRGFYPASDAGEWYWLASGEYRFPLINVDRGVGTVPVFVRNLSGAVVVDAGNAFDDGAGAGLAETLVGAGAEVRLYTILGYGVGISTRLGYAFSLTGEGVAPGALDGLYVTLGSSF